MKAALEGRQDPKLVIAGRTSAAAVTGLDDAIARAKRRKPFGYVLKQGTVSAYLEAQLLSNQIAVSRARGAPCLCSHAAHYVLGPCSRAKSKPADPNFL